MFFFFLSILASKFGGRFANGLEKDAVEGADTLKSAVHGDLREGLWGGDEEVHGVLAAVLVEYDLKAYAEALMERTREIIIGIAQSLCHIGEGEILGVVLLEVRKHLHGKLPVGVSLFDRILRDEVVK